MADNHQSALYVQLTGECRARLVMTTIHTKEGRARPVMTYSVSIYRRTQSTTCDDLNPLRESRARSVMTYSVSMYRRMQSTTGDDINPLREAEHVL